MSSILQKNWISFQPFILNNVFKRPPPPPRPPPLPQICYLRLPQTPDTWGWPLPRCSSTSSTMSTWPLTGEQHDCFQLKSIVARYSELHKIQPFRKHLFSYSQIQKSLKQVKTNLIGKPQKKSSLHGRAIKKKKNFFGSFIPTFRHSNGHLARGGGGSTLMAGPVREELFLRLP